MKVAVSATGETMDSPIDPRFGRAARFVLFDTDSGTVETADNSGGAQSAQGAGIQAAETVSRLGAECLITGHCGPKAYRALEAAGIQVYIGAEGTISQAIEQLEKGRLRRADGPDVGGHWA